MDMPPMHRSMPFLIARAEAPAAFFSSLWVAHMSATESMSEIT